ncbi:response regulator transcription factor [Tautonia marina]|uniref:response regulator transcription factor n=1 Tax=Tautonia marina TaxID=2653855 RepID=UPI00126048E3|nr:response regulator [Tautonia marina]
MSVHLLLAESDPTLRSDLADYFLSLGFQVETANDGLECLDRLRSFRPEVLVIDADLAWGGGDGVLRLIQEGQSLMPPAVVAIGQERSKALADRLGLSPIVCLSKPVHPSSLVIRIATQLFSTVRSPLPTVACS